MIDLYKLRIFWAVVQAGSFSTAADQLFVTQSAVSQHIKDLESSLGETLFERGWRGVTLTAHGETLARYAQEIFDLVAKAEQEITNVTKLSAGKVSIGVTQMISVYRAPEWVQRFRSQYPKLMVVVQTGTGAQIGADVLARRLDLGIVEGQIEESHAAKLKSVLLDQVEYQVVFGARHTLWETADGQSLPLDQLRGYSMIVPEAHSAPRLWLDHVFRSNDIDPQVGAEVDNLESMKRVVAGGLCLAILPRYVVEDELNHELLRALPVQGAPFTQTLRLLYGDSRTFSPVTRAFLAELATIYPAIRQIL